MSRTAASERILPAVLMLVSFVATSAVLVSMMAPTVQQNQYQPGSAEEAIGFAGNAVDGEIYTWYECWDGITAPITSSNVTNEWKDLTGYATSWRDPQVTWTATNTSYKHMHDISTYIIRNHTPETAFEGKVQVFSDSILFRMDWGVFRTDNAIADISYVEIERKWNEKGNYSRCDINLNTRYSVFVTVGPGDFHTNLWSNKYNFSIGYALSQAIDDVSPWSIIGQILTFDLPDTDPVISILIAVPFYMTMAITGLVIITWFKPLS